MDSDDDEDDSEYDTDDEVDSTPVPAPLYAVPNQLRSNEAPVELDVQPLSNKHQSSNLPLFITLNARSLYNKNSNFKDLLYQIGPDFALVSETWERKRENIDKLLNCQSYKTFSYARPKVVSNRQPAGGCAIIYNDSRFKVTKETVDTPEKVEAVWALCQPITQSANNKVKRIIIGSIYVSPNSQHKLKTIDHIIGTIHSMRAKYDNNVNFLISGDVNRLNVTIILDSYGALKQVCSVPTRKFATLEIVLTDLHTLYHPPTTLPPLEVDEGKTGANSDHNIVVFAPLLNQTFQMKRKKKVINTRPLPQSSFGPFELDIQAQDWSEVMEPEDANVKVQNFHRIIRDMLEKHFPEKTVKISNLD